MDRDKVSQRLPIHEMPRAANRVSVAEIREDIDHIAPSWLEDRWSESQVIIALPNPNNLLWKAVFDWTDEDRAAECILTQACLPHSLGITREEIINSGYLHDTPNFLQERIESKREDGTEQQINSIRSAEATANDIQHRMRGAAGWLICNPLFLSETEQLRQQWQNIDSETCPSLPLCRSPQFSTPPSGSNQAGPSPRLKFQREFDKFCDHWRLLGMFTWELPNVDGPKWTNHYPGRPETREGMTCFDTPFHFPQKSQDELGTVSNSSHQQLAEQRGFVDQNKWATYAQLLRLSFWEHTIDQRYAHREPVKAFVTKKLNVLSEILSLEEDRIRKLRRLLKQLKNGTRSDLTDWR